MENGPLEAQLSHLNILFPLLLPAEVIACRSPGVHHYRLLILLIVLNVEHVFSKAKLKTWWPTLKRDGSKPISQCIKAVVSVFK